MANYCQNCGTAMAINAKFCPSCGRPTTAAPQGNVLQIIPQTYGVQPQKDASPLSLGQFLIMLVISSIPIVGLVLLFVWGFGSNENVNRQNYSRAMLIMKLIGIVLTILIYALLFGFMITALNSIQDYGGNSSYSF